MSKDESKCDRCGAQRIASMSAKCSDCCFVNIVRRDCSGPEHQGYVPGDMGIGGGDYIVITWCLECGKIQNDEREGVVFPLPSCALEASDDS